MNDTQKLWIGVDLDGTLARYDGWQGIEHIGEPILRMVRRVRHWLDAGREVRIFTARVSHDGTPGQMAEAVLAQRAVEEWCLRVFGEVLPVTNEKDRKMVECWDDRCVQVERNTGRPMYQARREG